MIEFEIENNGSFAYEVMLFASSVKIRFYGKNYNKNRRLCYNKKYNLQ